MNVDSLVLIVFGVLPLFLLQIVIENIETFFLLGGKWRFWWELWQSKRLNIEALKEVDEFCAGGTQVQKSKVKCKRWKQWWGTCDAWLGQKQFVIFQSKMCVCTCAWQRESYVLFVLLCKIIKINQ